MRPLGQRRARDASARDECRRLAATALPSGTILVTDVEAFGGNGGLIAVDPATGRQTTISEDGMFTVPGMVALEGRDRAFVADSDALGSGAIIAVDLATGQQTKVAAPMGFGSPSGIARQSDGQLVVGCAEGDPTRLTVARVNPATGELRLVAPDVSFFNPAGVALDAAENVIVVELDTTGTTSRVHRIDHGGGHVVVAENAPPGATYTGVAIDRSGRILVGNIKGDAGQLLRFRAVMDVPSILAEGRELGGLSGIAVDASGAILVANGKNGIVRIDPLTGARSMPSVGGSFALPNGIAVIP